MEHVLARLTSTQSREPLISQGLSYCKCCLMSESQRRTSTPRASAHLPWSLDTPARLLQLVVSHSGFATLGTGLPPSWPARNSWSVAAYHTMPYFYCFNRNIPNFFCKLGAVLSAGCLCARFLPSLVAGLGPGIQDDGYACEPSFGVSKTPRPLVPAKSKLLAGAQPSKSCLFSTSL